MIKIAITMVVTAAALQPGTVYTNTSESVEWAVPRAVKTQLLIANEGLQ